MIWRARRTTWHNLANFIDSDAAIPAQVLINGGSATTANTITPSFTDPFTRAVTLGSSFVSNSAGALTSATQSISAVTASKTAALSLSNVATQNWAYDPVSDPDQLARLYVLYRFAVMGNDNRYAQAMLARDYPLSYKTTTTGGSGSPSVTLPDENALKGPNCVLCSTNVTSTEADCVSQKAFPRDDEKSLCLNINPRLLPPNYGRGRFAGRWLKWRSLPGAARPDSVPPPEQDDISLGQYGNYQLYLDKTQPQRFAQFQLFIAVAATSSPNPSSAGGGGSPAKAKGATAIPTGIILTQ